jgi:glucose/mannose transport system substrate-binding protein
MFRFASCGTFCTALLALAVVGCGSDDPETATQPERVEILTAWSNGGEEQALAKLIEIHQARRPAAEITASSEADYAAYQERLTQRMTERNPPDTFQSNMGKRLLRWVGDGQSNLEPVTQGDWAMDPIVLNVNRDQGGEGDLYAVPISIIRQSSFYYSPALLEEHGIEVADLMLPGIDGVNALLDACATLRAGGVEHPFGLGNQWDWTLDMLFWENLFPAIVGPEYYEAFWRGEKNPASDPELDDALNILMELSGYFNEDFNEIDFPEQLTRIADGQLAFGQQGDWSTGLLGAEGYTLDSDFGVMPFPGTSHLFIFSEDVFPISAGTPNRAATQELLNTIASEELQVEFNIIKGSLPARSDIDVASTALNDAQKATYNHFADPAVLKIPVVHGFKADDVMSDLAKNAKTMVDAGDQDAIDTFKTYIAANYSLLGQ